MSSTTFRTKLTLAVLAAALPATAAANILYSNAPKQTPAQAKNFDWVDEAGGLKCQPKGKLAELVGDPYNCYLNLDECKASVDALTGKLDAGFVELFQDMAQVAPDGEKAKFVNTCPGENGPEFVELLAIRGLGYLRDAKNGPTLAAIVDGPRAQKVGTGLREAVSEAFAYMGSKDAAEASYVNLLKVSTRDGEYKSIILASLDRWNSDAGVAFCSAALTDEDAKKSLEDCIFYLGRRKAKDAAPMLSRLAEQHAAVVMHAYGQMGDKSLLKEVQAYLDEKDGQPAQTRLPAIVAAINLGDAKALAELQTWLAGKRPLSKKDLAKGKGKAKPDDSFDQDYVKMAAMESVLLTDAKAIAAVKKTLAATMAKKDDKAWKAYVYATIALAQMGDAKAQTALAELINSPKEDIRNACIDALGGREMHTGEYFQNTGKGYVASDAVAAALEKYLSMESKKDKRTRAINALGTTRAMLVKH